MAATFEIVAYKGRTTQHDIALKDADAAAINAQESQDVARFKLGRRTGATPTLDLDTLSTPGALHGSRLSWKTFTPAVVTLTLTQKDMDSVEPGTYDAEVILIDNSVASPSGDPAFPASFGVVHVVGMMGGSRGLT